MATIVNNWMTCNSLIYSMVELTARRRLSLFIPTLTISHPIKIQKFYDFAEIMERIEEWAGLHKECVKKFGEPSSIMELVAATRKTVGAKKAKTPYIRDILTKNPRLYSICKIAPTRLRDIFSTNDILRNELLKSIEVKSENTSMANWNLIRASFPNTFKQVQDELSDYINCLENLD